LWCTRSKSVSISSPLFAKSNHGKALKKTISRRSNIDSGKENGKTSGGRRKSSLWDTIRPTGKSESESESKSKSVIDQQHKKGRLASRKSKKRSSRHPKHHKRQSSSSTSTSPSSSVSTSTSSPLPISSLASSSKSSSFSPSSDDDYLPAIEDLASPSAYENKSIYYGRSMSDWLSEFNGAIKQLVLKYGSEITTEYFRHLHLFWSEFKPPEILSDKQRELVIRFIEEYLTEYPISRPQRASYYREGDDIFVANPKEGTWEKAKIVQTGLEIHP
jgi:hypothetical protein